MNAKWRGKISETEPALLAGSLEEALLLQPTPRTQHVMNFIPGSPNQSLSALLKSANSIALQSCVQQRIQPI